MQPSYICHVAPLQITGIMRTLVSLTVTLLSSIFVFLAFFFFHWSSLLLGAFLQEQSPFVTPRTNLKPMKASGNIRPRQGQLLLLY